MWESGLFPTDGSGIGQSGPSWLMVVQPERREVFVWLDFMMIVGFMLICMIILTAVLALTTGVSAWIAGLVGADSHLRHRFVELGYQYAPVAMVSLIIGLGGDVFDTLAFAGFDDIEIGWAKGLVFVVGICWSVFLGYRILATQGVGLYWCWLPLAPGVIGSFIVAAAWWPAIFPI